MRLPLSIALLLAAAFLVAAYSEAPRDRIDPTLSRTPASGPSCWPASYAAARRGQVGCSVDADATSRLLMALARERAKDQVGNLHRAIIVVEHPVPGQADHDRPVEGEITTGQRLVDATLRGVLRATSTTSEALLGAVCATVAAVRSLRERAGGTR